MGSPRKLDVEKANDPQNSYKGSPNGFNLEDRSCTDILCCLIWFCWTGVMIAISIYAFIQGDPQKILTKFDSVGNRCGFPNQIETSELAIFKQPRDFTNYPLKYFTRLDDIISGKADPSTVTAGAQAVADASNAVNQAANNLKVPDVSFNLGPFASAVCVKECPKAKTFVNCMPNSDNKACDFNEIDTVSQYGYCLPPLQGAQEVAKWFYKNLEQAGGGSFQMMIQDMKIAWPVVVGMGFCSLVLTIAFLFLLRWIVKPVLYLSLFFIFAAGALIALWCFLQMQKVPKDSSEWKIAVAGGVIASVITFFYVIFVCCQWSNISIGAQISAAAGDFLSHTTRLVLFPIIFYVFMFPIIAWWALTIFFLYSMGEPEFKKGWMIPYMQLDYRQHGMFYYLLFSILWIIALFMTINQFVTKCTAVIWYFSGQGSDQDDKATPVSVSKGLWWSFRYHFGTLAFGSFLVALVTFLRIIFEIFCKKFEDAGEKAGPIWKIVACCVRCCLWCLECCVKVITENAYVHCAINGTNFCTSAHSAFYTAVRYPGLFAAANIVGWIMSFIGKGIIVGITGLSTILIINYAMPQVQQPYIPTFIVCLIAWTVAALFLGVFDAASLTILHCFMVSEELDLSTNIPSGLKDFIESSRADGTLKKKQGNQVDNINQSSSVPAKSNAIE